MNNVPIENDSAKIRVSRGITKLISLARAGKIEEANIVLRELGRDLANLDTAAIVEKLQIIEKIRAQYTMEAKADFEFCSDVLPVDAYVKDIQSGISVVTCCMNRSENLLKAIRSWIDCPEISQIVIVDWSSTIPFKDDLLASGISDDRILIARVIDQPRWILSYAFNLGFRLAGYDKILKTDADIVIRSSFFQENELKEGTFLSGDWRTAEKGQEHINGFFFVRRADLMCIKGFNEYITTYGWDDDDIYFRLEQYGFNRVRIKTSGVYHIPHGDAQRVGGGNGVTNALEDYRSDPSAKIMGNRFLAGAMPMWGEDRVFLPFEVTPVNPNYLVVRQSGDSWYQVPPHVRADADYYGLVAVLSWATDLGAYSIKKDHLYALLEARRTRDEVTRLDIRLATYSQNPVFWHRQAIAVYFEESIDTFEMAKVMDSLGRLSVDHSFSVFIESSTLARIKAEQNSAGISALLTLPEGFYTHDLPECAPSVLQNLPQHFLVNPAFWVRIHSGVSVATPEPSALRNVPRRSRLYIHVQHGLGNRLRAYASAASIARQSDRDLVLIWEPDNHCMCTIHDLFNFKGEVVTNVEQLDLNGADRYTYMEIEPGACKDQYISLTQGRDLYIRSAYVINNELSNWESDNQMLRELEPLAEVQDLIRSVSPGERVGVHIRMEGAAGTDHNSYDASHNWLPGSHEQLNEWRGKSHYSRFMNRIDQLVRIDPGLKFFLAADLPETYRVFAGTYGDRFAFLERQAYDRSNDQLRYALADALLLSRCNSLLGSTWSSFSELAQRFSTTISRVEMSGIDF